MGEYGDFEEVKDEEAAEAGENAENPEGGGRVRLPRGEQKIGIIVSRLGGNRMEVKTTDGKLVNCRVPGRFKRSMWLRPKDIVMIEPWELDKEKADVVFKYTSSQIIQLRKRGLLASLSGGF
jgi:translation initiation factor 1A